MARRRVYRVNEVARLTGVSVRALHHYHDIGLLVPRQRSRSGYRLYDDDDLLRLQQVLVGRELGLSLEAIKHSLDDPSFDRRAALRAQLSELRSRAAQTAQMIGAVERALAVLEGATHVEELDMKQLFDGFDPKQYEDEARARWGGSEAYKESARRTARYTAQDWQRLRDEQSAIYADAARALASGKAADSDEVMDIADRHRASIDRWFYPCSVEQHARLADLYENDRRYAANMDKHAPGLTDYLIAAIRANAARRAE